MTMLVLLAEEADVRMLGGCRAPGGPRTQPVGHGFIFLSPQGPRAAARGGGGAALLVSVLFCFRTQRVHLIAVQAAPFTMGGCARKNGAWSKTQQRFWYRKTIGETGRHKDPQGNTWDVRVYGPPKGAMKTPNSGHDSPISVIGEVAGSLLGASWRGGSPVERARVTRRQ